MSTTPKTPDQKVVDMDQKLVAKAREVYSSLQGQMMSSGRQDDMNVLGITSALRIARDSGWNEGLEAAAKYVGTICELPHMAKRIRALKTSGERGK